MHRDYCKFLQHVEIKGKDIEQIRFDTYWAGKLGFTPEHKKSWRDPVSQEDKDLVASAVWARYAELPNQKPSRVAIISPDTHISRLVTCLTNKDTDFREQNGAMDYEGIKVIRSR